MQIELDQKLSYIRQLEEKLFATEKLLSETKSEFNSRETSNHNYIQSLKKELYDIQQVPSWPFQTTGTGLEALSERLAVDKMPSMRG